MQELSTVLEHRTESVNLGAAVSAIGESAFERCLLTYLNTICGAEHFALLDCSQDIPSYTLSGSLVESDIARIQTKIYIDCNFWRQDEAFAKARHDGRDGRPSLIRMDVRALPRNDFRARCYDRQRIRDRFLLSDSKALVSILRGERNGTFSSEDRDRLNFVGPLILSVVKKHAETLCRQAKAGQALHSLGVIEDCIAKAPEMFPRRELEVCARIIYGMTTLGISLDLGIAEETVTTYRRRAYNRLSIACQRELLTWYLSRWGFGIRRH